MAKHKNLFSWRLPALVAVAVVVFSGVSLASYLQTSLLTQATQAEAPNPQETQDQANQVKWKTEYASNLKKEINDIARDANVDVSQALTHHSAFEACITNLAVGSQTFWDKNTECDDASRAVENYLQDNLRPLRECSNFKNNAKDRTRESNDMARQLKDIKRSDKSFDVSAYEDGLKNLKSLVLKLEQCTVETIDATKDVQDEVNDRFRDWHDSMNELREKIDAAQKLKNLQQDIKNIKRDQEKNMLREFKNVEKEFKRAKDVAGAQEAFDKIKAAYDPALALIPQIEQAFNAGDTDTAETLRSDFWDLQQTFWETMNDERQIFNVAQQLKDVKRVFKEKQRFCKDKDREYKRAVKEQRNTPELDAIYQQVSCSGDLLKKMQEPINAGDPQAFWDLNSEYDETDGNFWDIYNVSSSIGDSKRRLKDMTRECNDRANEVKRMKKEAGREGVDVDISALEQIVVACNALVDETKKAFETKDFEVLQTIEDRMWEEVRGPWEELSRGFWERKQMLFEIENVKREIEHAKKAVQGMLRAKKISEEEASTCLNFIADTESRLHEFSPEDLEGLEEQAMQVCPFLEDIGEAPPPDVAFYREFIRENVGGIDENRAAEVLEKVSQDVVSRVLQKFLSDPTAMQNLLQLAGKDVAADVLESATTYYDEEAQREFLAKKEQILTLTKQLEELTTQVQIAKDKLAELQTIRNEIAAYNFYGSAGDKISSEIEEFISEAKGLSREEIKARIGDFKAKAKEAIEESKLAKVEAKIIPFLDTDDSDWFTKYVAPLARLGIVRGKGEGRFDPAANVTVAETIVMGLKAFGKDAGCASASGGKGHWAQCYIEQAEKLGLAIASSKDVNRKATRKEVVVTLLEAAGINPPTVEKAVELRIFSGERLNDPVVRAEAAKILVSTLEVAGADFTTDEPAGFDEE